MRQGTTTDCQTSQIHHLLPNAAIVPGGSKTPAESIMRLPRPYYQRDGVTLYHGHCFTILAGLAAGSIDALITDPPYSSGGMTMGQRAADPRDKYCQHSRDLGRASFVGDNRDQRSFAWWATMWVTECHRIVRDGGYSLIFTDWRQLPLMTDILQAGHFTWRGVIAWDKGGGSRAPHKGYFRHQCEYVVWGTKGHCPKATHAGPYPGCVKHPVLQSDKHHMTGKPTPLMRDLVQCVVPGGVVLDPFAGSGTTGVACQQTGRNWIGIEIAEGNCEIAARRLDREIT